MMNHIELQYFASSFLDIMNARIAELNHFMTIRADQMIMLLVAVRFFVLRQVFTELMFGN